MRFESVRDGVAVPIAFPSCAINEETLIMKDQLSKRMLRLQRLCFERSGLIDIGARCQCKLCRQELLENGSVNLSLDRSGLVCLRSALCVDLSLILYKIEQLVCRSERTRTTGLRARLPKRHSRQLTRNLALLASQHLPDDLQRLF